MRLAAAVEYIGTEYSGWQRQHHVPTVQGKIESVLSQIADSPVEVTCAGRTDAGVHALGQLIHFDVDVHREPVSWLFGANSLLPRDISLRWLQPVSDDFHARFSAQSRSYRYLLHEGHTRSALLNHRAGWSKRPLDVSIMHEAGQCLLGEHDFSAFRAAECQSKTAMRCLSNLQVSRSGTLISIDVQANAFLHHMVRNIVGVLVAVGSGKESSDWVKEVLESRDRTRAGVTASADGLYFMSVKYPDEFDLPRNETTEIFPNVR